jgi:hypothetical protein
MGRADGVEFSMEPGIYILTADVPNPSKVDRRRIDWPYRELFKKGTLFIFREQDVRDATASMVGCVSQPPVWQYFTVKRMQPIVDALAPSLAVLNPRSSLGMLMLYYSEVLMGVAGPGAVLADLMKEGTVTLEQIEASLKRLSKIPT